MSITNDTIDLMSKNTFARGRDRATHMYAIANSVSDLLQYHNPIAREHIMIVYTVMNEELYNAFSGWDQRRLGLSPDGEWFLIWDTDDQTVLYAVNVSADAVLTAAWELLSLMSRKF